MMTAFGLIAIGLVALVAGGELLVRGASRLAAIAGISPLVIGLTVVAFGTSAPELAVSIKSSLAGTTDIAVGNVVGSNIFNVLFILGLSALISPLVVSSQLIRIDVPLMIGASVLTLVLALDGSIGRVDGALLASAIVAYTVFLVRQSRRETAAVATEYEEAFAGAEEQRRPVLDVLSIVAGLGMLVVGARWLVQAAVGAASALGVSELVIGLTVVAAGTSLPEVATSVLATIRGERDIAVGNVVGSNIFNLFAVLGIGSLVAPAGVPVSGGALTFDIPVMTAVAVATLPIFFTGHTIARWEGAVLLGYYVGYTGYLVLDAAAHPATEALGTAVVWFVLPLTVLTLVVSLRRAVRER